MANKLTPPPPTGNGILDRWLALLYQNLTAAGQMLWASISKAGSNLTDLETRNHADLQNLNTASYTHLTATNHTDLTDAGDSALHYHATDRARANHTGTQTASTISDFSTATDDRVTAGIASHVGAADPHTQYALNSDKLSAFAATTSAELAGVISDETGSGALVFGTSPTVTGPTISSGDLTFSGTGQRIVGDFVNSTLTNRVLFQCATANSATSVGALPSGSGTSANFTAFSSSNLTATNFFQFGANSVTGTCQITSAAIGVSHIPINFVVGGAEGLRIEPTARHTTPGADNTQNFGSGALRWKELFCGNATINTSDAREKTSVRSLSDAELTVAKQLSSEIGIYQWLAAVEEKGDGARLHVGMTVQRAMEIFAANGLDPFRYGLVCYDEWGDKFVEHKAGEELPDGTTIDDDWTEQTQAAGNRYGFRGNELLMLIAAGFNARLSALESA